MREFVSLIKRTGIIDLMNLASVDLNLLVAFEALLEERHVGRAARRVGLSQPAMSNALARLRGQFGDVLFTRSRDGMLPTARALELARPVQEGLAHLRTAVAGPAKFEPATSNRTFRLAMIDYAEMRLLGPLLELVVRQAPGVQVQVRRLERIFIPPEPELRAGSFDVAIGFFPDASAVESDTHVQDLFAEENVCIARRGHPLLRRGLRAKEFAAAPQVGIFYRAETRGLVDARLAEEGLKRRLSATTPHFLTVPHVVATSDLVACVPRGLAERFRKWLSIEIREMPVSLPPFHLRLAWHEHTHRDAGQQWLRGQIVESAILKQS